MTNAEALRVLRRGAQKSSQKLKDSGNMFLLQFVRQWDEIDMKLAAMLKDEQLMKRLEELDQEQYEEASFKYNSALRKST